MLIPSTAAAVLFWRPSVSSFNSRVSSGDGLADDGSGICDFRNSSTTQIATSGDITAPPPAISLTASSIRTGGVFLRRYPQVPAQIA